MNSVFLSCTIDQLRFDFQIVHVQQVTGNLFHDFLNCRITIITEGGHEKINPGFLGFLYSESPLEQAATAHQIFINQTPAPLSLNPIDRLYSMQTSYFCGEDTQMVDQ